MRLVLLILLILYTAGAIYSFFKTRAFHLKYGFYYSDVAVDIVWIILWPIVELIDLWHFLHRKSVHR